VTVVLVSDVDDGLAWTSRGCVGVWRLGAADSLGLDPADRMAETWERLAAGLAQLPRYSQLHGATRPLDPAAVAGPIRGSGERIERERRGAAALAADRWDRVVYVSAPLEEVGPLRLAADRVGAGFGLRRPPAAARPHSRLRRKRDMTAAAASDLRLAPAPADEILRLFSRVGGPSRPGAGEGRRRVRLQEGFGARGGGRRWVLADDGVATTYHAVLVVEHMSEWVYPGAGEWWRSCDMLPFPVEWSVHLDLVPNRDARNQLGRRLAELDYQDEKEHESESSPPRELMAARDTVESAIDQLAASSHVPLAQPTMLFWVSAGSLDDVEARAETVRSLFEGSDITMVRPLGAQRKLLQSMAPGAPLPLQARGWEQLILPKDLASGLPVVASPVGDPGGGLVGWQQLAGSVQIPGGASDTAADREAWTCRPVYFDASEGPAVNRSGAAAFIGDQGAGKSMTSKKLARDVVDRGGRVVVYDPTEQGEWADWARSVAAAPLIVTLDGDVAYNLDPLQVFTGRDAAERYGLGLLSLLTGAEATGAAASTLRAAVASVLDQGGGTAACPAALRAAGAEGRRLADSIDTVLNTAMGRALLSGSGRAVTAAEQVIVFRIPSLSLPTEDELAVEWRSRHILPEQVMGQAAVYLMAAAARELTMAVDVFGVGVIEEAYHIVRSSPQGRELVLRWVRDSRKHNASVWLLSQSIHDADEELRSLLGNRFVFRQGQGLGEAALEWLGLPAAREYVDLVERELVPGECLFRDLSGRVGVVRVERPIDAAQAAAFDTTPGRAG